MESERRGGGNRARLSLASGVPGAHHEPPVNAAVQLLRPLVCIIFICISFLVGIECKFDRKLVRVQREGSEKRFPKMLTMCYF